MLSARAMTNVPSPISSSPLATDPLMIRMIAAGSQMMVGPITGMSEHAHIIAPQKTGPSSPSSAKKIAAERALHGADDQRALERGARHRGEALEERPLARVAERQRARNRQQQLVAVAQEEEQHVEHQEELARTRGRRSGPHVTAPEARNWAIDVAASVTLARTVPGVMPNPAPNRTSAGTQRSIGIRHGQFARREPLVEVDRLARHRDGHEAERDEDDEHDEDGGERGATRFGRL